MIRKFSILLFCLALLQQVSPARGNSSEISIIVNDIPLDASIITVNNRVLVPVRVILEHLGAKVAYEDGLVTLAKSNHIISFRANDTRITINGEEVLTDQPAIVYEDFTYVPLRFIGNALGYEVLYDVKTKTVRLLTNEERPKLYGYVEDLEGKPVVQGTIIFVDQSTSMPVDGAIIQGFYRIPARHSTYKIESIITDNPYRVRTVDHTFVDLTQSYGHFIKTKISGDNLLIRMTYPDGTPVKHGVVSIIGLNVNYGHPVTIVDGIGQVYAQPDKTLIIDYIQLYDVQDTKWDVATTTKVHSNSIQEWHITLQRHNAIFSLIDEFGEAAQGSIQILGMPGTTSGATFGYALEDGSTSVYLPDGEYEWTPRENDINEYLPSIPFRIIDGQADRPLIWKFPAPIQASVLFIDGTAPENGFIHFWGITNEISMEMNISDAHALTFRLPDDTYRVTFYSELITDALITENFIVKNGQAESSTNFIVQLY